jgi:hypothetical protein
MRAACQKLRVAVEIECAARVMTPETPAHRQATDTVMGGMEG